MAIEKLKSAPRETWGFATACAALSLMETQNA
jgi:hypothetical protein